MASGARGPRAQSRARSGQPILIQLCWAARTAGRTRGERTITRWLNWQASQLGRSLNNRLQLGLILESISLRISFGSKLRRHQAFQAPAIPPLLSLCSANPKLRLLAGWAKSDRVLAAHWARWLGLQLRRPGFNSMQKSRQCLSAANTLRLVTNQTKSN